MSSENKIIQYVEKLVYFATYWIFTNRPFYGNYPVILMFELLFRAEIKLKKLGSHSS